MSRRKASAEARRAKIDSLKGDSSTIARRQLDFTSAIIPNKEQISSSAHSPAELRPVEPEEVHVNPYLKQFKRSFTPNPKPKETSCEKAKNAQPAENSTISSSKEQIFNNLLREREQDQSNIVESPKSTLGLQNEEKIVVSKYEEKKLAQKIGDSKPDVD